jgi:hypothetical protein
MPLYTVPSQNFVQKTLSADLLSGVTASATLNNAANIQNLPGVMIVDRVDSNGTETLSKREVVIYSGVSGSTVTGLTRNADGSGTDQDHQVGAIVEFSPDVLWGQAMYDALTQVVTASTGLVDYSAKVMKPTAPYIAVGSDATGDIYYRGTGGTLSRLALGSENQVLTANASLPYWAAATGGGGGTAFWSALPTTPTWTATNQMSIDDVANAGSYDKLFSKGVLFKWDAGAFKTAMSAGASYASNKVYIGLLGSTLATGASFPSMKYAIPTLEEVQETFIIPGTLPSAATTNISKQVFTKGNRYYLGSDLVVAVNGSGATLTVVDFNDDSVSLFPAGATLHNWLPTLATTSLNMAFVGPETAVAAGSKMTLDVDSTNQTAQTDAYFYVYSYSESWRYRS